MYSKGEILEKLKQDLEVRRYSEQTIKRYLYITERFLNYSKDKNINILDEDDVLEYLNYLTNERKYKASSYNNVNAILKFFLEVTLNKNIGYKKLPNAKLEIRVKVVPTKEEILKIIKIAKTSREKAWISLAYGSGLRVSEIARLKVKNINSTYMKIIVKGKGNKERITVLPKTTLNYLLDYCKRNNIKEKEQYLFKGQNREHISEGTISETFKKYVKKSEVRQNITMHSLRRSFATHLLKNKEGIDVVQRMMGHNSITTTSGYVEPVCLETKVKNPLDSESYE